MWIRESEHLKQQPLLVEGKKAQHVLSLMFIGQDASGYIAGDMKMHETQAGNQIQISYFETTVSSYQLRRSFSTCVTRDFWKKIEIGHVERFRSFQLKNSFKLDRTIVQKNLIVR